MKLWKLKVLMWKHYIVRRRHFILTLLELISPVVLFLILFCVRDKIQPLSSFTQLDAHEIRNSDAFPVSELAPPRRVLYSPNTTHANNLMDAVGNRLDLRRVNSSGFDRKCMARALLVHNSLGGSFLYKRDICATFYNGSAESHKDFGKDYHRFMSLQWAIDASFIEMRSGHNVTQALSVQEFPPVPLALQAGQVVAICTQMRLLCFLSLVLVFGFLMPRLIDERSTGIKELVKMVGVSSNLFGISQFLNVLPAGLVYSVVGTILLKMSSSPVIPNSDGFLIFITLALHFISVMSVAFPCSYMTDDAQQSMLLSICIYAGIWMPAFKLDDTNVDGAAYVVGLLPHVPMNWLWFEVAAREQYGKGLSFSHAFSSHSGAGGPVALGALCMVLQALVMFALTWYLAQVAPGKYGQALPWNFCLKPVLCRNKKKVIPQAGPDEEMLVAREDKFFEDPPNDMETGIKVENVTKVYPKHTALNNVSLDVYKGEITVLLGHNGAGKTTLMSIIAGMTNATEGRVLVNGVDTTKASDEVRMQIGLCPQHNLFFPDLTVLEHAMFFTLLKGGSFKDVREKSYELLKKLGIRDKAKVYSSALSGGMKRRLQLACALASGASVLVLDEPTSGLDVATRRELWDLLLSLRGDRTVLLTTHFMEEADALGDRVATLYGGRLRCFATTMYLKKAIGTGYRLTFTTNGPPREAAVTAVVTSLAHDATLKEETSNSLSYNLPATHSKNFPALFSTLEEKKNELGIETIGVGSSTLEEVFLKLCSAADMSGTALAENQVNERLTEPTYNKVTGLVLYWRQFKALLKRQYKYILNWKISYFMLQIIMPIITLSVITAITNNSGMQPSNENILLDLNLYAGVPERRVMVDVTPDDARMRALNNAWSKVDFIEDHNVIGAVLRASKKDATDYNKYIAGIEINDTHAKALFTTTIRHAAPISVNLLSNALAARYMRRTDGHTFLARFDPISPYGAIGGDEKLAEPKNTDKIAFYSVLVVLVVLGTNINLVSLPCKEFASNVRHIHLMTGCPAVLYWGVTLAVHACVCSLFVGFVAVAAAVLDFDDTINKPPAILSMALVLMVASLAFLALAYNLSSLNEATVSTILTIILLLSCIVTPKNSTKEIFQGSKPESALDYIFMGFGYVMPPHGASVALTKVVYRARLNALCENNRERCPNLIISEFGFNAGSCCAGVRPAHCYLCLEYNAAAHELIVLTLQFFVYMSLVILVHTTLHTRIYELLSNGYYRQTANKTALPNSDEIIRAEAMFVDKLIALPKAEIEKSGRAMLVSNLHKNYVTFDNIPCASVKGISFSVKKGECFGLLGVNGAGKSTIFKMLTAEIYPTIGNIYGNGFFIKETRSYLRSLGYCPQFFGLDDFLTGRENLELLLSLRGLDSFDVLREAYSWIQVVGLEKYSDLKVGSYSGGCARRLAAAAALSSGAPLTLLDEPTAGVDVSARRRVWSALQRGLAQGRAVIITSHSMDEMEALCARIAIMSAGLIRALGTPSELRARHAVGHSVVIKTAHVPRGDADVVDSKKSELMRLKNTLLLKFDCTLKDEHQTMLHYHINEVMQYSDIFATLEALKVEFSSLVEDYSVTETTLEEVFLSFAKEQQQNSEPQGPRTI